MSITLRQADDLLVENYGSTVAEDDPDWWLDMTNFIMEYPSVKALRRSKEWSWMRVPQWWPGATDGTR